MTPAAVKQLVGKLESSLDTALFRRDGRGLALTRAGQAGREDAQQGMLHFARSVEKMGRRTNRRRLLITAETSLGPTWLVPRLAELKARRVADKMPDRLVLGCDQVLALGDTIFEKPRDINDARTSLMKLRGAEHELHSAVALADNGSVACGYEFNSTPTVTLKLKNKSGTDSLSISVGNIVGKCKC